MRRVFGRGALVGAVVLAGGMGAVQFGVEASMIERLFQDVQQVGVTCAVDGDAASGILSDAQLCETAAAVLERQLGPDWAGRVAVLGPNDERLVDPDTLVFAVHAAVRSGSAVNPPYGGTLIALALHFHRERAGDDEPLFSAAPEVVGVAPDAKPDLEPAIEHLVESPVDALRLAPPR